MRLLKFFSLVCCLTLLAACQPQDSYFYEVNPLGITDATGEKTKEKSLDQFISILHANMFQKAISASELVEVRNVMESIGDKEVAFELLVSNFMNRSDVIIPTDEEMREDIDTFLIDTYKRFFVRIPTEAEKAYLRNFIETNPDITAELVYYSFAMSEEYRFY
ncbi:MAG: hypothetical protein AAF206_03880 [Bacteroidota bacterium]